MKKGLTALFLMGSLAATPLQSQNLNDLHTETDQFKYIPEDEVILYKVIPGPEDKPFVIYWYDKNRDLRVQNDEMFIDINMDFIPDMLLSDFVEWYNREEKRKNLRETSG